MPPKVSIRKLNKGIDDLIKNLNVMADASEEMMPLASKSLRLTIDLVKLYKKAFNKGFKYAN